MLRIGLLLAIGFVATLMTVSAVVAQTEGTLVYLPAQSEPHPDFSGIITYGISEPGVTYVCPEPEPYFHPTSSDPTTGCQFYSFGPPEGYECEEPTTVTSDVSGTIFNGVPASPDAVIVWEGYKCTPSTPPAPTTKADCKNGGYEQYGFRNQGQCMKYVNTN